MVETGLMARQPGLDLAQGGRPGELAEQQGQQLGLRIEPPHPAVGPVLLHKPVEHRPGKVLLQRVKDAIVMAHDIDLLLVSRTPRNV